MGRIRIWIVFICLSLLSILQYSHFYVLIPNIRPIATSMGTSYSYVGLFMGLYIFLTGIGSLVWSIVSDFVGIKRKLLMLVGIVICGFTTILSTWIENPYLFAAAYILAGMAISVVTILSMTILIDFVGSERRSVNLMLFKILAGFGYVLGFALGLFLGAKYMNWRFPILILGAIDLIVGIPLAVVVPEPPKGFSEEELSSVLSKIHVYPFSFRPSDIRYIVGNSSNRYIALQGIFGIIAAGSIEVWMLQYLVVEAGANELIASVFMGLSVLGAFGGIPVANLADKTYRDSPGMRPRIAGVCSFLAGLFIMIFLTVPLRLESSENSFGAALISVLSMVKSSGVVALALMLFFLAIVFNSPIGSIRNSVISDVNLPEHRATVISGINIVELFSKSIGIAIIGFLIDILNDIRIPLMLAVSCWFISAFFWFVLSHSVPQDKQIISSILTKRKELLEEMYLNNSG